MQAAYYERTGPASEVLQLGELPDPQPGPGEVRVRMQWSGVNPSDVKSRAGLRSSTMPFPRVVPHSDGMGVIDAVGERVPASQVGRRVWVWNAAWQRPFGTAAQFVVLPQLQAVGLPAGTPDEVGACLGIPALTALHAMRVADGVAGQTVLVHGGAGAVGHYAVQFARLLGARRVIATVSSAAKAALAREAGAQDVIDYKSEGVADRVRQLTDGAGVDRVVEVDIAANGRLDIDLVRSGGQVVVFGSGAPEFTLPFFPLISKNVHLHFFIVYNLSPADREAAVGQLTSWLRDGVLKHNIAERLPLAEVARAHDLVASGSATGNVVLRVD